MVLVEWYDFSGIWFQLTRGVLKVFSLKISFANYIGHAKRKIVTAMDVAYALKYMSMALTLYGFGRGKNI